MGGQTLILLRFLNKTNLMQLQLFTILGWILSHQKALIVSYCQKAKDVATLLEYGVPSQSILIKVKIHRCFIEMAYFCSLTFLTLWHFNHLKLKGTHVNLQ